MGCEEVPSSGLFNVRVDRKSFELVEGEKGYTVGDLGAYASALHKLALRLTVRECPVGEAYVGPSSPMQTL